MTNAEKFKEVFGFDLKGTCRCSNEKHDSYCKESPNYNITDCILWLNEEYKKVTQ